MKKCFCDKCGIEICDVVPGEHNKGRLYMSFGDGMQEPITLDLCDEHYEKTKLMFNQYLDERCSEESEFVKFLKSKSCVKKHHVHIYKVVGKIEKDIEAESSEQAKSDALTEICEVKEGDESKFGESDCKYIAMDFEHD